MQSVDKFKSEQGQGGEIIAMLKPMVWFKGTVHGHSNGNRFEQL